MIYVCPKCKECYRDVHSECNPERLKLVEETGSLFDRALSKVISEFDDRSGREDEIAQLMVDFFLEEVGE